MEASLNGAVVKLHGVIMGEVMRVIMPTDNVHDAVDAVRQHGFAAIEGTQTQAVPFCRRLEEALAPYDDIEPITSFQCVANRGYLYLVVESELP
ncbi:hypothetical protein [Kushneria phosphatilytica]|uniref:hypothetical protein n=1 Tax=Kushneria phosphatilytica TaxID=657387 RepID=UPI0008D8DF46|nr:hypothetical protein [Kushneria phosphatilytica]OHV13889.1 hypothetical protein BH688_00645 [Kushneria phosphatilytica]